MILLNIAQDYGHIGNLTERINFQVNKNKRDVENYILGSKDLPRKYRKKGVKLEDIPDGVDSTIDNYRESVRIQESFLKTNLLNPLSRYSMACYLFCHSS